MTTGQTAFNLKGKMWIDFQTSLMPPLFSFTTLKEVWHTVTFFSKSLQHNSVAQVAEYCGSISPLTFICASVNLHFAPSVHYSSTDMNCMINDFYFPEQVSTVVYVLMMSVFTGDRGKLPGVIWHGEAATCPACHFYRRKDHDKLCGQKIASHGIFFFLFHAWNTITYSSVNSSLQLWPLFGPGQDKVCYCVMFD